MVEVIRLSQNFGFARPVNLGIKKSKTRYILILNNDTILDKNCLRYLIRSIKNKKVAGVTPKILFADKPSLIESTGDYMNIIGQAFHRGFLARKERFNKEEKVFLIPATAALFKRSVFQKIGLFDEFFFAYGEDVDWCLRAQLKGFKFIYQPKAGVYHKGQGTGNRNLNLLSYLCFRNWIISIIKNFPLGLFFKNYRFILIPIV